MVPGTFDNKSLSQQAEMVCGLVLLGQFLQAHSGTHALGIPVAALHIVHFGHQQQSLVQVLGLEGNRKELLRLRPCKRCCLAHQFQNQDLPHLYLSRLAGDCGQIHQ